MTAARVSTLDERYLRQDGTIYLTGLQALVRMLLDRSRHDEHAGLRTAAYVSGYEGSPLAGYDLELARQRGLLREHRITHQPGLNEELAATAVSGTQLIGSAGEPRAAGRRRHLRRRHRHLVRQGTRPGPGHRRAAARQPDRHDPLRRRGGAGRRRPGRQVLHRAVRVRACPGRPGHADLLPGRPGRGPPARPARGRAVAGQRPVVGDQGGHRRRRQRVHRGGLRALDATGPVRPGRRHWSPTATARARTCSARSWPNSNAASSSPGCRSRSSTSAAAA